MAPGILEFYERLTQFSRDKYVLRIEKESLVIYLKKDSVPLLGHNPAKIFSLFRLFA